MQKARHHSLRSRVFCLRRQAEIVFKETPLRPFHSPSVSEEEDREGQVLLQSGWREVFNGVLESGAASENTQVY